VRAAARRLALVAAGASGAALTLASPAMAASGAKVPLARSAWFYTTVANQVGAPAPAPVTEPTGVPHGDDAVAFTEGQSGASSKETLLQFALPIGAAASTVTAFTVSMQLDSSPTAPQAGAKGAPVVACLPTRGWSPGEAQDSSGQPTVDCSHGVAGVWKGNQVSFAIAKLAQSWVDDTNLGIALVNDPKNNTQPFQAVFSGGKQVTATMTYVPAGPATTTKSRPHHRHAKLPANPPPSTPNPGSGSSTTVPSLPTPNLPTGGGSSTVGAGPSVAQPPQVANPQSANSSSTATTSPALGGSSVPPKGFWVAAAVGLILLAGAALALEDQHIGPTPTGRGRLDRLLRDPTRLATFKTRSQP